MSVIDIVSTEESLVRGICEVGCECLRIAIVALNALIRS
jgi:hypothetical protein